MQHHQAEIVELYASIGKLITSSLNLNDVLKGIMEEIRIFFNPENWSLLYYNKKNKELSFLIAKGLDIELIKDLRIKKGEGVAGYVVETGLPLFVFDTSEGMTYSRKVDERTGFKTRSIIAVPIQFQTRIYGVLEIVNRKDGEPFTEVESTIMQTIADFSAIAFSNVYLYRNTLRKAHYDSLTGVLNRASLNDFIEDCESNNMDTKFASVTVIDLDNFKEINDQYGHLEGDRVLVDFANAMQGEIPPDSKFFRTGGDEFLLSITGYSERESDRVIESINRLCDKVKASLVYRSIPIDFSYGSSFGRRELIKQLIYKSDRMMYRQKKGRL